MDKSCRPASGTSPVKDIDILPISLPMCMGVTRRVKKTEVPPCLRQVVNYGGFFKIIIIKATNQNIKGYLKDSEEIRRMSGHQDNEM